MRARVAAASAAATAGSEPRPSSASPGNVARSMSSARAPRAASRASAYSTSTRDLEVAAGLPESPTTAGLLLTLLTRARSAGAAGPASPWRRRFESAWFPYRDATEPYADPFPRRSRPAPVAERARAGGGESGAAGRGVVLRLERVRDPAALLGRKRDRGGIQRAAHAVGAARQPPHLGGEGRHHSLLYYPLWPVHHRPRRVRAHAVRRGARARFPGPDRVLPRGASRRDLARGAGPRGQSWRVVCVQLHRRGRVPYSRTGRPDGPAVRSRHGAARRDPGGRLSRSGPGRAGRGDRHARGLEDRLRPRRAPAGASRPDRRRPVRLSHPARRCVPCVARSFEPTARTILRRDVARMCTRVVRGRHVVRRRRPRTTGPVW